METHPTHEPSPRGYRSPATFYYEPLLCDTIPLMSFSPLCSPRVLLVSDFLQEDEAERIIRRADGHMFKSGVSLKAADAGKSSAD